jgi:hypothetical protein
MATTVGEALTGMNAFNLTHGTNDSHSAEGFQATGSSGSASLIYELMRGFDSGLGRIVFWYATAVDTTGIEYTGVGPLSDIHWVKRKG